MSSAPVGTTVVSLTLAQSLGEWAAQEQSTATDMGSNTVLVGSTSDDQVGFYGVTELSNGNYLVRSPFWHNDSATNAGAITWGNGATGISGVVSSNNSLIGSTSGDQVGYSHDGVTELTNGNYVVRSPMWDNGSAIDAGAVTWGDGSTGISGMVGSNNSVVGSTSGDQVGYGHR
ncbi:MAG: hypothetical protein U0175_08595 [Caldilineaceae bacterium]